MTRYDQTLIIQFDHVVLIKKNGRFFINNQLEITTFFVQQIGYVQQKNQTSVQEKFVNKNPGRFSFGRMPLGQFSEIGNGEFIILK